MKNNVYMSKFGWLVFEDAEDRSISIKTDGQAVHVIACDGFDNMAFHDIPTSIMNELYRRLRKSIHSAVSFMLCEPYPAFFSLRTFFNQYGEQWYELYYKEETYKYDTVTYYYPEDAQRIFNDFLKAKTTGIYDGFEKIQR